MISTRKPRPAARPSASKKPRRCGPSRATIAVMRMCSPRRRAITAPSMASQRKRIEASSSDQVSGAWNTERATMPENSTATSATTRIAAGISTMAPRIRSAVAAQEPEGVPIRPEGGANSEIAAMAEA